MLLCWVLADLGSGSLARHGCEASPALWTALGCPPSEVADPVLPGTPPAGVQGELARGSAQVYRGALHGGFRDGCRGGGSRGASVGCLQAAAVWL